MWPSNAINRERLLAREYAYHSLADQQLHWESADEAYEEHGQVQTDHTRHRRYRSYVLYPTATVDRSLLRFLRDTERNAAISGTTAQSTATVIARYTILSPIPGAGDMASRHQIVTVTGCTRHPKRMTVGMAKDMAIADRKKPLVGSREDRYRRPSYELMHLALFVTLD